eukprot:TRINITY_DN357_c1_g1_i1.p1 TRINITY_DN357_c1_g1~~TRINITY_DN357_c1_g1_i1.p1  ORF type:complete len:218 (-),score=54.56 TRINITY_DN357_c1_g1_i1:214-867(-)
MMILVIYQNLIIIQNLKNGEKQEKQENIHCMCWELLLELQLHWRLQFQQRLLQLQYMVFIDLLKKIETLKYCFVFLSSNSNNNNNIVVTNNANNGNLTNINNNTTVSERPVSSNSLVATSDKECFVDITAYLNLPQTVAAKKLGMPTSTLSKRWREAVRNRKWPYRVVNKLDKEITTLLHNIPQGPGAPPIPEDVQEALGYLLRRRQEELRPVIIRV